VHRNGYATLKSSSSIAILANSAGAIPSYPAAEFAATDCDHAIAVHLTSVFRLAGAIEEQQKCR
jgi:NAD(P)-dependent dehydrogenase (short-subunit alcohol dehydrogenase family)